MIKTVVFTLLLVVLSSNVEGRRNRTESERLHHHRKVPNINQISYWNSSSNSSGNQPNQQPHWTRPNLDSHQWINQLILSRLNRTEGQRPAWNNGQWASQINSSGQEQWKLHIPQQALSNANRLNETNLQRAKRSGPVWVPVTYNNTQNSTWNQTTNNGDVIIGQIGFLDRLLFNQTYRKEAHWWTSRETVIRYPNDVKATRQETITAIRIYNRFLGGLKSTARVVSGGVGYRYVKIKLTSNWNKGFAYTVQIYGR